MARRKTQAPAEAPVNDVQPQAPELAPVQEAPRPAPVRRGNGTVAVALNHPLGVEFRLPGNRRVVLKGSADHLRGREKGVLPEGAYSITLVPEEDWEYIKAHYGGMAIFKNGLCFARETQSDVKSMAEERRELRHGFEAADPERGATRPASSQEG